MSNLLSTASGMALVIGTAVLVTVALAMALAGPTRYTDSATSAKAATSQSQPHATATVERR
jgi:hypothetical protein